MADRWMLVKAARSSASPWFGDGGRLSTVRRPSGKGESSRFEPRSPAGAFPGRASCEHRGSGWDGWDGRGGRERLGRRLNEGVLGSCIMLPAVGAGERGMGRQPNQTQAINNDREVGRLCWPSHDPSGLTVARDRTLSCGSNCYERRDLELGPDRVAAARTGSSWAGSGRSSVRMQQAKRRAHGGPLCD